MKIDQAIDSIDKGEFGQCTMCNGKVETERLEFDFTTEVCLSHYSDTQIRELENNLKYCNAGDGLKTEVTYFSNVLFDDLTMLLIKIQ